MSLIGIFIMMSLNYTIICVDKASDFPFDRLDLLHGNMFWGRNFPFIFPDQNLIDLLVEQRIKLVGLIIVPIAPDEIYGLPEGEAPRMDHMDIVLVRLQPIVGLHMVLTMLDLAQVAITPI
jgi:hypothetical protein